MAQVYVYYVPYVVDLGDGRVGHSAKVFPLSHRIGSKEDVVAIIDSLVAEVFSGDVPEMPDGFLPVTPLNFQLLYAQQGPTVQPQKAD
jgi:hypothetical protein